MFIVLRLDAENAKVRIDEGNLRQRTHARRARRLGQEEFQRQKMRINSSRAEGTEAASLGRVLEIIGPGNVVRFQQIEDRTGDRFISSGWRKNFRSRQMTERRRRQQVRPVGKRWAQHGAEISVVDGELLRQVV